MDVQVLVVALGWSVLLGGAFGAVVALAARRRGRPGLAALAVAAVAVCAVAFPLAVVLVPAADLDVFGVFSVVWWSFVVGVPLAGVLVLVQRPTRPATAVAAVAVVLPLAIGVWGLRIEPTRLELVEVTVPVDGTRAGAAPVRVGVISDIQFRHVGDHERAAVARLSALAPDVIVVPGDIYQGPDDGFEAELGAIRELLGGLRAPGGVYLVGGDVDQPIDRLPRMVEGTGVRYLRNEVVDVTVGDTVVRIGGIELQYGNPAAQAVVAELESAPGDEVRLLVAHRPDVGLGLPPGSRIDLVVAGHTHGGQITLPLLGPVATASGVPRAVAAGGLHPIGGGRIFVATGVGMERSQAPPVRLGVPPTIAVVTLSSGP